MCVRGGGAKSPTKTMRDRETRERKTQAERMYERVKGGGGRSVRVETRDRGRGEERGGVDYLCSD